MNVGGRSTGRPTFYRRASRCYVRSAHTPLPPDFELARAESDATPKPHGLTLDNLPAELKGIAERTPGALVIVDSLRGAIARLSPTGDPLKVDDLQRVEEVCQPLMEAAKTLGLTICIIDHRRR
jgi:hypothetical protein